MKKHELILRQATQEDADTVATVARTSLEHFLPYLPDLYSLDADKDFYRRVVFAECEVWVYERNQEIVGFCAFQEDWIDQLYFLPTYVGRGLGKALLNKAKTRHPFLQLIVFQRNTRAISFY